MPEITAEIIVQPIEATFVQNTSPLNVTVDTTTMSVYAGGFAPPGGNIYEIQFNNNGALGGAPNTAVSNGNISFGNVANVKITGGTSGYYLQTDGSGNLTWAQGTANVSGNGTAAGANTQIQISDGTGNFVAGAGFTFDTASNIFTTPGDIATAGNINGVLIANSNVTATLFTGDGGGLSNINVANIPNLAVGKIANGTSNVDTPVLDGNVTISVGGQPNRFIVQTVGANVEGNLGVTGNVDANIVNANTANITGNATANNISVSEYANVKYLVANVFVETDEIRLNSGLIKLGTGAAEANSPAQGIAIGLGAGNANLGLDSVAIGSRAGNLDQANNSIILNATGANLTTSTANSFTVKPVRNDSTANILFYNDTTGEITYDAYTASQIANGSSNVSIFSANGNISVGVNGIPNVTVMTAGGIETDTLDASYVVGNGFQITGILTTNITDIGNIATINLNGNTSQYLDGTGNWEGITIANVGNYLALRGNNSISIGSNSAIQLTESIAIGYNAAGNTSFAQDSYAVAVGAEAGWKQQREGAVAVGRRSGYETQGDFSVAVGYQAGFANQDGAVAMGLNAGSNAQSAGAIAIGGSAAYDGQGLDGVAIGANAGGLNQGTRAIAIGQEAGSNAQGSYSIAIGASAGYPNAVANNSIVINATGANLDAPTANAMFVKPVRSVLGGGLPAGFKQVAYNPTTGEFIYYD